MTTGAVCERVENLYGRCIYYISATLQPLVLLIFRLYWGFKFYKTGLGKLQNHDGIVEFFTSLGIPAPGLNAWFIGGLECVGGLLLLVGLCSRPIAFMMTINMFVAYYTAHNEELMGIFSDPKPFLDAEPFFFLLMSVLVLAFGPGRFSLDALIHGVRLKKKGGGCCSTK